jgi:hypothetical protein
MLVERIGWNRDLHPFAAAGDESGGVEFIDENGGGPGVRLRKAPKQKR